MRATIYLKNGFKFVADVGGSYNVSPTSYTHTTVHKFVGWKSQESLFVQGDQISHVVVDVE